MSVGVDCACPWKVEGRDKEWKDRVVLRIQGGERFKTPDTCAPPGTGTVLGRSLCQIHLAGRVNVQIMHRYTRILHVDHQHVLLAPTQNLSHALRDARRTIFEISPYALSRLKGDDLKRFDAAAMVGSQWTRWLKHHPYHGT